jgi:hypothetical protein
MVKGDVTCRGYTQSGTKTHTNLVGVTCEGEWSGAMSDLWIRMQWKADRGLKVEREGVREREVQ